MKKVFRKRSDHLRVTVTHEDKIFLPLEGGGKEEIGDYEQTTIQKISPSHINTLVEFVKNEKVKADSQVEGIKKQIDELGDVQDMSEEWIETARGALKVILDKANFKKIVNEKEEFDNAEFDKASLSVKELNEFISKAMKKKALLMQLEYIEKQLKQGEHELKDLLEAINQ